MDNIIDLPNNSGYAPDNASIADSVNALATSIYEGRYGQVRNVHIVIESKDGAVERLCCGMHIDPLRMAGLFLKVATHVAERRREGDM